ncbi:hypothetical protein [Streptomyces mirabilis]|uniref:hypothetical protein n=1 Tax=Streptomyces mirabilis TaxID=68239 RepID=UPI00331685E5
MSQSTAGNTCLGVPLGLARNAYALSSPTSGPRSCASPTMTGDAGAGWMVGTVGSHRNGRK